MASTPAQNPRYEANESPPLLATLGFGAQFSLIASVTLLVTPVVVAKASGKDDSYLAWMVFASLVVCGAATLLQVRRLGPVGAGAVLPMFTAAFSIPFCISAVVDGGPATLTTLVIVMAAIQIVISKWLFILRRIVTPIVGGTVMMILSITLASVVPRLLEEPSLDEPVGAPLTALATLGVLAVFILRGSAVLRLWGPVIGIVVGCGVAAAFGFYNAASVIEAPWIGPPSQWPGLGLDFGIPFWTLLPAFLFLGVIISIQANGEAITQQRVAWRQERAVDFRQVQGALAGTGVTNLISGIAGAVPSIINPGAVSYIQTTGVASRRVGYCIGCIFIVAAFLPKVSGLLSTIPGPVMAGYLIVLSGTLFVDGARLVIQTEQNRQKVLVAGVCFWIGAAFQFGLFSLTGVGPVWSALLESGITTGGLAVVAMILYLELTNPRRMRFQSRLHADALPELNEFIANFAARRGWDAAMKDRLSAGAEETLLTLAPLDLSLEEDEDAQDERRLVVVASSDGEVADLEFIGGGNESNIEDQVRQLQQHDSETPPENEISLRLLRSYASSVRHQQYHGTDIITVRVAPPGTR
ncbi:MAG: purine/pyrimidine permease [Dehalococcoidia bacterium]|nr:purine/pyrimidine permease [Dehalococcoidia bacterium]